MASRSLFGNITRKIGIDLGTTRTRIWSDPGEVIVDEPSCLAINRQTNRVVAVGNEASEMFGRVTPDIEVIFPLQHGVIQDHQAAIAMLRVFLQKVLSATYFFKPIMLLSVSGLLTSAEREVVTELFYTLGAREVYTISQVLASAIGSGVPIADASGSCLLYLGGGVSEAGVVSLSSLVASAETAQGGVDLNQAIKYHLRQTYQLAISTATADRIMKTIATLDEEASGNQVVAGQDLATRAPREIDLDVGLLRPIIALFAHSAVELVKQVLREIPPELTADVIDKGMLVSGGVAQLHNLTPYLIGELGIPVAVVEDPDLAVIKGLVLALEHLDEFKQSLGYQQ